MDIIEAIDKELEELSKHRMNAVSALAEINEQFKRYEKAREILVGTKVVKRQSKTNRIASNKTMELVRNVLESAPPDTEWNAQMVVDAIFDLGTTVSVSTINTALKRMRQDGVIDLVRMGGRTGTTKFFKLALEQEVNV